MTDGDADRIIAEAWSYLSEIGAWNRFVSYMEEMGYGEDELEAAAKKFGRRIGRDM